MSLLLKLSKNSPKLNFKSVYNSFQKHNQPFDPKGEVYTQEFQSISGQTKIPTFQIIGFQGELLNKKYESIDSKVLNHIYDQMVRLDEFDLLFNNLKRQGKISFYMSSFGESAAIIGSVAALDFGDPIEQGALLWRGFTILEALNQCAGNCKDINKGRQMPIHYGSKKLNVLTVSSPLTTQVPQAAGVGYSLKLQKKQNVAATYFGEGAASEGDFHSALNFAQTLSCQTLFLCRNNKWAISTPITDQFGGDGIAGKSVGYGIQTYRVDGNDALAVYYTTQQARQFILKEKKPAFVELMTYRIGDHSTSDSSQLYRQEAEIDSWKKNNNPITRLGLYLEKSGKRSTDSLHETDIRKNTKKEVSDAMKIALNEKLPSVKGLFTDVYSEMPKRLQNQQKELEDHIQKYYKEYNIDQFENEN